MVDNLGTLTNSLQEFITNLRDARDDVWQSAFMRAYDSVLPEAYNTLARYASEAADNSGEYAQAFFKQPLIDACMDPDSLVFTASSFGPGVPRKVRVFPNLEDTAGPIEDYAQAVEAARQVMDVKGRGGGSAASYWRALYRAGQGEINNPILARKYADTMEARMSSTKSVAPWWYLLSKGNAGTMGGSAAYAYPAVAPSNFDTKAAEDIERAFNTIFTAELEELTTTFARESVDIRRLMGQVVDAVVEGTTERVKPGTILLEVKAYGKRYQIHVTKTARLGFKQA